jgi:hypothetical protein
MFDLLLAIKHLPALNAQNLSVRFRFDRVQSVDECIPFRRIPFNHRVDSIVKVLSSRVFRELLSNQMY